MKEKQEKSRYLYIDNLRLLMIILVVLVHLAVTYSGIGDWYIEDIRDELDTLSTLFFGLFQSFTQSYFMGFLFLISGYFVAKSFDKKGAKKFVIDRLIRLGVPVLIYMLVIQPFIRYVLLGDTWNRPTFSIYYFNYLSSFDFIGSSGPLWFAFALLIFNLIYVLIRIAMKKKAIKKEVKLPNTSAFLLLVGMIALGAFLIRLNQPIDSSILNMQLCFFSQYIIFFIVGIKAGRYDWFTQLSYKTSRKWLFVAIVPGIIVWFIMMIFGGALSGGDYLFKGGLHWQSAAYALWESFIAVAIAVGLLGIFKEKYNKQSRLIKTLSDNSFGVYVFHAPVIISLSILIKGIELHPLVKFIVACIIGLPLCFAFSHFIFRRIPFLKRIL